MAPSTLPRDGSADARGVQSAIDLLPRNGSIKKPQKASDVIDADPIKSANKKLGM